MSQVKNLLAVFEQKGGASPPDRGRVQTLSDQSESSRPLSRVRASFIAVEKDGRVGLQRDPSADSFLSATQKTGTSEGEPWTPSRKAAVSPPATQPIQHDVESKPSTPVKRTFQATGQPRPVQTPKQTAPMFSLVEPARTTETPATAAEEAKGTPELAPIAAPEIQTPEVEKALPPTPAGAGREKADLPGKPQETPREKIREEPKAAVSEAPEKETAPADSPSKTADIAEPPSTAEYQPPPEEPKTEQNVSTTVDVPQPEPLHIDAGASSVAAKSSTANAAAGGLETATKTGKPGRTSPSSIPTRTKASRNTKDTPAVATAKKSTKTNAPKAISTTKSSVKPPLKTPTSPAKPLTPKLAAFTPETKTPDVAENPGKAATPKSAVSSSTADKSTAPSSTKRVPSIGTSFPPNGVGFVKPKPKSPTRPVHLPPSLTAHTAASATKLNMPRQSLSRQSGSVNHAPYNAVTRSPSRVSISSVATTTMGTKTLKRQSSTIARPRPSIGPPPKQPARDHQVPKKEKEVTEDFLARMMRPTQASILKAADRVQLSQQRKVAITTAKKPALRESQATKRSDTTTGRKSGLPRAVGPTSRAKKNGAPAQPAKKNSHPVEEAVAAAEHADELPVNQELDEPENTPEVLTAGGDEEKTLLDDVDACKASAKEIELGNDVVAVEN